MQNTDNVVIRSDDNHCDIRDVIVTNTKTSAPHLQNLDGLRGFACLMVVFYHCHCLPGNYFEFLMDGNWLQKLEWQFLQIGYSGVDLFFILSGFCLSLPLLQRPYRKIDWKYYARKRINRILPPYWAAMAIICLWSYSINHYRIQPFYGQNYLPWDGNLRSILEDLTLFSYTKIWSYWTLPLEWRWYIFLPLVVLLARRFKGINAWIILCASTIFLLLLMKERHIDFIISRLGFKDLILYLSTFSLGVWAAYTWTEDSSNRSRIENFLIDFSPFFTLLSFISIFFIKPDIWHPISRAISFGPFYFFLLLSSLSNLNFRRFFSSTFLTLCGGFSYSLYLVHEIIIRTIFSLVLPMRLSLLSSFLLFELIVFPFCILMGYLFFVSIERHFLGKKSVRDLNWGDSKPILR